MTSKLLPSATVERAEILTVPGGRGWPGEGAVGIEPPVEGGGEVVEAGTEVLGDAGTKVLGVDATLVEGETAGLDVGDVPVEGASVPVLTGETMEVVAVEDDEGTADPGAGKSIVGLAEEDREVVILVLTIAAG